MTIPPPAPGTFRVALLLEYDGSAFAGFQRQHGQPSIQSALEDAAAALGLDACRLRGSGRTDAGVHARGQVVALDLHESLRGKNLVGALNWHLPESIRVRRASACDPDFDPRRDARRRTYRYLLCAGQPLPPLMRGRMGAIKARLDLDLMREAGRLLEGEHDFRAWRSTMCQSRRTVLTLERAHVRPWSDAAPHGLDTQCFEFEFACRSFLHRMVRYLVGGMTRVGSGELSPADLARHLDTATLPPRVAPAPAEGLSLERVDYASGKDPWEERQG